MNKQLVTINAVAVLTGSFLSGAMMSLSLVAVPVLLDTTSSSPQLFYQWVRLYHYGHRVLPGLSLGTLALYAFAGALSRAAGRPWAVYALAGAITVAMIPFTWIFMAPTNNTLFELHASSQSVGVMAEVDGAKGLLRRWSLLHLTRSLFPLTGAVVGLSSIVGGDRR
ncbi:hypothetical protein QIS74_13704 [Colletotrichum tabaci]|uniref:Monooxygenase n=1 Tax=Colletotrichum tabaci TaxID=1209068 RepID=A0AAV9SUJ8_9PEZI